MRTALLIFVFWIAGCQISGPVDPRTKETVDHQATWEAFQDGTYNYILNRGCFCIPGGRMQVQVVAGTVTSATYLDQTEVIPEDQFAYIETINDMFALIEEQQDSAFFFEVEYSESGYPRTIQMDIREEYADDELWLEVTELHVGVK